MLADPVPRLGEGETSARLLEDPPLRPEQPVCLTCPLPGLGQVACG